MSLAPTLVAICGLVIDSFAGGGGASRGIHIALGRSPHVAINHDRHAIEMHTANHPTTKHYREDVWEVDPDEATDGQPVGLMWLSPDCKHFSRAKGATPVNKKIRGLAWVAVKWAVRKAPTVIIMENVPEFTSWGPLLPALDEHGDQKMNKKGEPLWLPDPAKRGATFREFISRLQALGYVVEWRTLNAADYGAPTSRRRWFLIARRDEQAVVWPAPTHGPGRANPYRTAAECIDWTLPCPSIFGRKKPLADATMRRIAEGVRRFVLENPKPFLVKLYGTSTVADLGQPMPTVTAEGQHLAVCVPYLVPRYGEREGQAPRTLPVDLPMPTIVPTGNGGQLVAVFLAKHNGKTVGQPLTEPTHTVTAKDTKRLVYAFLVKYYKNGGQWQGVDEPLHTVVTKARFGLVEVTVDGEPYVIADIGMRMLSPRELARAQGFDDSYILTGTKTQQIARIGNSVCPPIAAALVSANVAPQYARAA